MKHLLVILGVTAGLVAPLSAQTSSDPAQTKAANGHATARTNAAMHPASQRPKVYYYITDRNVTGSHIPMMICRYEGHNYGMFATSHTAQYSSSAIGASGSLTVQGALSGLDPSVSIR